MSEKKESSAPALLPVYRSVEYPFELVKADGVYVYDASGKRYIDFYGGHCVASVGHSVEELVSAISAQGKELFFYSNLSPIPVREQAAKKFLSFSKSGHDSVFFCNSGAEANENALKIAIKARGCQKICAFSGAFHGRTLLALGATDISAWHELYRGWVGEVERIAPNDIDDLLKIDSDTAAVILEPIQSIGGVVVFEPEYLKELRAACDENGTLLIFDEVQTGVGRTGAPYVSGSCGVVADMMTSAKGLAGGFPIGAVAMTSAVAQGIQPGDLGATFGAGPLAMASMSATLDYIEKHELINRAKELELYVREKFEGVPGVEDVRGKGLLLGLVLGVEAKPVQYALFEKGIIAGLCSDKKVLHLLPPLTIERKHVDELCECLAEVLSQGGSNV